MQHVVPSLDSMHVSSNGISPCRVVMCRVIQFESVSFSWLGYQSGRLLTLSYVCMYVSAKSAAAVAAAALCFRGHAVLLT
jgi:hypothetical protein